MPKCFLAYSEAYRPVMEIVKKLLEALEFEVDLFDGPELERPPATEFQRRIASADCMALVLGPLRSEPGGKDLEPAPNPAEEGIYALGRDNPIPLALILHEGTRVPGVLRDLQTPVRFDFWDPQDVLRRVHHVVKHLLDLQRRVNLPPGVHPLLYTQAIARNRIQRGGKLLIDVYHEVVARQPWPRFHHALSPGLDRRANAKVELTSPDAFDLQATLNPGRHQVSIEFEPTTDKEIPYYVNVEPPLLPGERLGYRREFEVRNFLPLTRAELETIAEEEGFPSVFRVDGHLYYGDTFDVLYDMQEIRLEFHFPWTVNLAGKRALAISMTTGTLNPNETERCNASELLEIEDQPGAPDRVVRLTVPRPMFNHQYVLMYEPV